MTVRRGVTLVELLIVLALLGILASISLALWRPSVSRHAAIGLAAEMTASRLRALSSGRPTALILSSDRRRVERRVAAPGEDAPATCVHGEVERVLDLASYPRVALASGLERGIVWFPAGWGRSCDGSGVYNHRIVLKDPRTSHAVVVSSAGRIRWEAVR